MFRIVTPDMVRESFEASASLTLGGSSIKAVRAALAADLTPLRAAYGGGRPAIEVALRKKHGESAQNWNARLEQATLHPVVKPAIETRVALVYGVEPSRSVYHGERPLGRSELAALMLEALRNGEDPDTVDSGTNDVTAALSERLHGLFRPGTMREALALRINEGRVTFKVFPVVVDGEVTGISLCHINKAEDAIPVRDPDNADNILAWIETRYTDDEPEYRLWTLYPDGPDGVSAGWVVVDDKLAVQSEPSFLGVPALPFVSMGDGEPRTRNAAIAQAHLINRESIHYLISLRQGFSLPVVSGDVKNAKDAQGRISIGTDEAFHLAAGGAFAFASPNAPIAEHRNGVAALLAQAMRSEGVPSDLYKDTTGAEKPLAKKLSWTTALLKAGSYVSEATEAETAIVRVWAEMVSAFREYFDVPEFNPDDVGYSVRFRGSPLPTDTAENRRSDREAYAAGLMSITDYLLREPGAENADPRTIAEKAYRIEKDRAPKFDLGPIPGLDGGQL